MAAGVVLDSDSLSTSKLGTHAYWDFNYGRELETFRDIGDEGDVWFGEDSSDEILDWIARYLPPPITPTEVAFGDQSEMSDAGRMVIALKRKHPLILDVGCGNGQLLFLLAQGGYAVSSLTGIDYSAGSIELTNQIASSKGIDGLRLEVKDVLKDDIQRPACESAADLQGWDLITDKGTFDAICLSDDTIDGRQLAEHYPQKILDLLAKPGGIFLITSCNWTEEELMHKFVGPQIGFKFHSKIPRSTFTFGGSQGSTITTIAFQAI